MQIKRLVLDAILCAVALTIFVFEAQLPPLTAIPGIKPGLANIVTLFALVFLSRRDARRILLTRILLGAVFCGNPSVLFYSLGGGFACLAVETVLTRLLPNPEQYLWGISAVGALTHNTIQLCIAAVITKTAAVFAYLPYLWIAGILSGGFTGFCMYLLVKFHKDRIRKYLS